METKDFKSYYGNDRRKIYLLFSDQFVYSKENFNAGKISENDEVLLKNFGLKPNRKLLFSYHSGGNRSMTAQISRKNVLRKNNFKKIETGNSKLLYFRTFENDTAIFIDNLIPYKRKFIRIAERSKKIPLSIKDSSENKEKQQTFIFPEVFTEKPF